MNSPPQSTHFSTLSWNSMEPSFAAFLVPAAKNSAGASLESDPDYPVTFPRFCAGPSTTELSGQRSIPEYCVKIRAAQCGGPGVLLILFFARFLAIPLACQRFFRPLLFAGFQIEGMALDFLDDVFLLHLAFEAAERVLQ